MPLRADRSTLEWSLRVIAAAALAWLVVSAFSVREKSGGRVVEAGGLPAALDQWVVYPPADTLGLRLDRSLDGKTRDYLRAIRGNGTMISWGNAGIAPLMLEAELRQDPGGGAVVLLAGEGSETITLSDSLGLLDSVSLADRGMTVRVPAFSGPLGARAGTTIATAAPGRFQSDRSVVVLGMGGWESKFTVLALEERGWTVETRIGLAPGLATTRGRPFPLDTARHVAVVALDSSVAPYARQIHQFVRSGGGLILGEAASPYLPAAAPASLASVIRPAHRAATGVDFRQRLAFTALDRLREDAVILEERNSRVVIAAWRIGSGRVLQVGYRDLWRWRMEGGDNAVAEHRNWWAGLVAATAYRPSAQPAAGANPAPFARLVQEFGPPVSLPSTDSSPTVWPLLLVIVLVSLYAEWLSRRLRGLA